MRGNNCISMQCTTQHTHTTHHTPRTTHSTQRVVPLPSSLLRTAMRCRPPLTPQGATSTGLATRELSSTVLRGERIVLRIASPLVLVALPRVPVAFTVAEDQVCGVVQCSVVQCDGVRIAIV